MKTNKYDGFTLIEVMIVVVIVAVLAAIALPSFRDVVLKSRRSYAMEALEGARLTQEKFRANCIQYATTIGNGDDPPCQPPPGAGIYDLQYPTEFGEKDDSGNYKWKYDLSIINPAPDAISYNIIAVPFGDQAKDTKCGTFAVNQDGPITDDASYANAKCWKR